MVPKLNVPDGLAVTDPSLRNWTISPFGGMLFNITGMVGWWRKVHYDFCLILSI